MFTFLLRRALLIMGTALKFPFILLLSIASLLLDLVLQITGLRRSTRMRATNKILVIQSAEPSYVLNGIDRLSKSNQYRNCRLTVFCRNRSEVLHHFTGHPAIETLIPHSETRQWWKHLIDLRRERFDAVAVFFTADPSYWKIKYFALMLGIPDKLIFDENGNISVLSARPLKRLLKRDMVLNGVFQATAWRTNPVLRWVSRRYSLFRPDVHASDTVPLLSREASQAEKNDSLDDAKRIVTVGANAALENFLASSARLEVPHSEDPEVSIVIVLYKRAELTLTCLRSLIESGYKAIEVILIDNSSDSLTSQLLNRIDGATIVRNEENVHFLRGANQGAHVARGRYLLFLNNDTHVLPGSIGTVVDTIKRYPDIGAVGARLILPDGKLQEAGSIVWKDGSCSGYGRGDDPLAPQYMFRREVDYCGGAFLLTPRKLFISMGGFDEAYCPCYYEETDYCLRLWERGFRVVYEPGATVFHYEFASSSSCGQVRQLQIQHRDLLIQKHAAVLKSHFALSDENLLKARDHRSKRPRILVIEDRVPNPAMGAGYPRSHSILTTLMEMGWKITLYPTAVTDDSWSEIYNVLPREIEVMRGYGPDGLHSFLAGRQGYYDTILVSRPHNMQYFRPILESNPEWFKKTRTVYDAEALFTSREIGLRKLKGEDFSRHKIDQLIRSEAELASAAETVISVSPSEGEILTRYGIPKVQVLGHSIPPAPTKRSFEDREGFLFVGSILEENSPNGDAAIWFAKEVLPRIREELGQVPFVIAGNNRLTNDPAFADNNIKLLGKVDDLSTVYDESRVFVAPTRYAAGIPHKVHEAAAHGVPVTATSLLAQQLGWKHEVHLLVGDSPSEFARQCIKLYREAHVWERIRLNALNRVDQECSPQAFKHGLHSILSPGDAVSQLPRHSVAAATQNKEESVLACPI